MMNDQTQNLATGNPADCESKVEPEADEVYPPAIRFQLSYTIDDMDDWDRKETIVNEIFAHFPNLALDGAGTGFGRRDHDGTFGAMMNALQMLEFYALLKNADLPDLDFSIFLDDESLYQVCEDCEATE